MPKWAAVSKTKVFRIRNLFLPGGGVKQRGVVGPRVADSDSERLIFRDVGVQGR